MQIRQTLFLMLVSPLVWGASFAEEPASRYKIVTKREQDRVEVTSDAGKVVFSIRSPNGIGQVNLSRLDDKWPDVVMFRLHLSGLERFQLAVGQVKLTGAVSSQDGSVRVWQGEDESKPLDPQNPNWIEVRGVGRDGQPTKVIPLKDGYFEIAVPRRLRAGSDKSINLSWIDFYRN
ncbi:hypothetical protein [Schlesneria sp. DSM 10557]|uniref:hypothetical protein n=1 Tax=Schlesneria sp. DSM 10557 TaxID=3044399 RepID=UPI00359F631E